MTPDQVNQAVYSAITGSGESIIEGTIVALLPRTERLFRSGQPHRPTPLSEPDERLTG
jgi:hypothetical protein